MTEPALALHIQGNTRRAATKPSTAQQLRVAPEETPALLRQMIDLVFSRWHEIRDPAAWLATALRACCIEHRGGLPQGVEGGTQADAGGSAAEVMDAAWVAAVIARTGRPRP